ncbi:hypothetical protein EVAR_51248_1 [Eumeta japonica]|uniref:Uncharacterized protein n=1 Tax=Eumeta variegata TaxID=151549 RepID=A0A4C1X146_EUMVA|nr:hypothetical protein EVAR_51248_1 [Eumeta japonica]
MAHRYFYSLRAAGRSGSACVAKRLFVVRRRRRRRVTLVNMAEGAAGGGGRAPLISQPVKVSGRARRGATGRRRTLDKVDLTDGYMTAAEVH